MQNNSHFQQIKVVTAKGVKTILVFGLISMVVWITLLSLWTNAVYQYDWNILNSIVLFTVSAGIFLLIITMGIAVISSALVLVKKKFSNFINVFLGFIVAIPLVKLANIIIWVIFYSNGSTYSAGELSSNPLFLIPNILTILMLAYTGWKINGLVISESNLPIKE